MPGSSSSTAQPGSAAGGEALEAGAGTLVRFEPDERHSVASEAGARILLLLAPWPGEGHYRGERSGRLAAAARFAGAGAGA